ncbi:MAG: hypothetical protein KG003_12535 [Bacteroidetes bacterium]|nr:hypothetical protein [Bacteroidota bacterium]
MEDNLLIDILNVIPAKMECYIQAPSLNNKIILDMFKKTEYDYYQLLIIDETNKNTIVNQERETSFGIYVQRIEIKKNGALLFDGFDGVEFGIVSKNLVIPEWFKEKYVPETCMISPNW